MSEVNLEIGSNPDLELDQLTSVMEPKPVLEPNRQQLRQPSDCEAGLPREVQDALDQQARRVEQLTLEQQGPRGIMRTPSPTHSIDSSESFDSNVGEEARFQRDFTEEGRRRQYGEDSRFHSCHEEGQLHCLTSCPVGVACIVVLVTAALTFSLAMADVVVLAGSVEGECLLPDQRHCECRGEESFAEPGVFSVSCIQHHAASTFNERYPYPGPGALPSMCNFTREMQRSWVSSEEMQNTLQEAVVECNNALESEELTAADSEPCWMLPAERGRTWNHCVGRGDTDGPTFASNKAEARSLVSFSSILIFLTLLFLFKCPWTRTRQRAITLQEQTRHRHLTRRMKQQTDKATRSDGRRVEEPIPRNYREQTA